MTKVRILVFLISFFPVLASAQWGEGAAGALEGLGRAGQEIGRQMMEQEFERQRLERQMEQDRRRFEFQQQLQERQREIDRQRALDQQRAAAQAKLEREAMAAERSRLEAERLRLEEERAKAWVEQAHPGWENTVRTPEFSRWKDKQPASVKALVASPRANDAILMLDLYKKDTAAEASKPKTANKSKTEKKRPPSVAESAPGRTP